MTKAVWLGLLAGVAVFGGSIALAVFLPVNFLIGGLLLIVAFFLGPITGLGVYGSLARRAMGLPNDWDPQRAEEKLLGEQGTEITMTAPFNPGILPPAMFLAGRDRAKAAPAQSHSGNSLRDA
jgi:hypothetical protein